MKVLLTGATGFLGSRTLEVLASDHRIESVIATGRKLKKDNQVLNSKISYVLGDLSDSIFVKELAKGVDAVIHTAALSAPWGSYDEFYKSNVLVVRNLISAIDEHVKFIFVSSPSLLFEAKDKFDVKEEDLPSKYINNYAKTKHIGELMLNEAGIPYIIMRPRALIGRGDTVIMPRLIRAVEEGRLRVIGDGTNVVDLTPVDNVAQLLVDSLFVKKKAYFQTYNISNDNPVHLWDKVGLVLNKLNKSLPQKRISYAFLKTIASLMEIKSLLTNQKEPPLTVYGVATLAKSFTMDNSKAKKLLNYNPKMTVDEAIDDFVEWYVGK